MSQAHHLLLDLVDRLGRGVELPLLVVDDLAAFCDLGTGRDDEGAEVASLRGGLGISGFAVWGEVVTAEAATIGDDRFATAITPVKFDRRRGPPRGLAWSGRDGTDGGLDSTNRRGSYLYPVGTSPLVKLFVSKGQPM